MAFLQFVELFEGQGIDGAHQTKFAFQISGPCRSADAFGKFGQFGGLGHGWFDVEIAPQCFHCGLETHLDLGLFDLGAPRTFAHFLELAFGTTTRTSHFVETGRQGPHFVTLTTTLLVQFGQSRLDADAMGIDDRGQSLGGRQDAFDPFAPSGGFGTSDGVGFQSSFGIGQS